ncbi:hypothetical protein DdX_19691 [Ditylenchus destructor]|uniref:Secreted protein n=1 Tax=Ditylenchus destructor TaxID=166010 RepID=A0AAD4MJZ6_9BILA|nr:hypothetical protein DdX_19691 [Ditylenchus destructor]
MNSICLALCLVTVISFNVVVANNCPSSSNDDCDQNDPNDCREDNGICLALVNAEGHSTGQFGCCKLKAKNVRKSQAHDGESLKKKKKAGTN